LAGEAITCKKCSLFSYLVEDVYDVLVVMPFSNSKHEVKVIRVNLEKIKEKANG
jgi:transposase